MDYIIILFSIAGGVVAAWGMNQFMARVGKTGEGDSIDMIKALGSFYSGKLEGSERLGTLIHLASGLIFGLIYGLTLLAIGMVHLPQSLFLGLGFGFLHGLIVCYALMIFMGERHPLEQYRNVTLQVGVIHLLGHLLFGFLVGFFCGVGSWLGHLAGLG